MAQFLDRILPQRSERPLYDLYAELAELLVQSADTHSKVLGHGYRERTRIAPGCTSSRRSPRSCAVASPSGSPIP